MIFLSDCGVSTSVAHKIYKVYGEESIQKLKENPYGIVNNIYGIGFKTADMIAIKMGLPKESYNRCKAGIFYILNEFASDCEIDNIGSFRFHKAMKFAEANRSICFIKEL